MRGLRAMLSRVGGLFGGARRERELSDEIESHVEMQVEDNLRAGMTPEEARRAAMLQMGGVEKTKQAYRERSTLPMVENVVRDVRFALRQLKRSPGLR